MKMNDRLVIKVGTSTLAHSTGLINHRNIEEIVKVISDLKNMGKEIILVTSGAIGVGFGRLGITDRPSDIPSRQAAAAVGQCALMYIYDKLFSEYGHAVAQILLTGDVLDNEIRAINVKNTFSKLFEMTTIAIVNENDTVATEEIEFGDNDMLSALVAKLVSADKLIILSDIDGLYDKNPREYDSAQLIRDVYEIDDSVVSSAERKGSHLGTGGMYTKVRAAQIATDVGIDTHIINGSKPELLYSLLTDTPEGTTFHGKGKK